MDDGDMAGVVFYYDVVCPFAYMASRLVEGMALRTRARLTWRPVLLAGLYENTKAPQGKENSAMSVMAPAKLKIQVEDLRRQMTRNNTPHREPVNHPQKTVYAMRLLCGIEDEQLCVAVSKALYKAYWEQSRDLSDPEVLQSVVKPYSLDAAELIESKAASAKLRANTKEAADRGAFGVPSFYVGGRLFWGVDRMFFVERQLGLKDAHPERLRLPVPSSAGSGGPPSPPPPSLALYLDFASPWAFLGFMRQLGLKDAHPERLRLPVPSSAGSGGPPSPPPPSLTVYLDFASPWAFLGFMRMESLLRSVQPVEVKVEYVPILLGALFKEIGTPLVPMAAVAEVKRQYMMHDLNDWSQYAGVPVQWPSFFPLRSVLPLRVALASHCDPRLIKIIYQAVWQQNRDVGKEEVLREVLVEGGGFDADQLLKQAQSSPVKDKLRANTQRAIEEGVCGVPSYRVNRGPVVWGQDKLNIVADMLCGWQEPPTAHL